MTKSDFAVIGQPLGAAEVTPEKLQAAVLELRGAWR